MITLATDCPHPVIVIPHARGGCSEPLIPCDWDKAQHRHPNPVPEWRWKHAIACNLIITGRSAKLKDGNYWITGKVIWVGDGEPDTSCKCLIMCYYDGTPISIEHHQIR